MKKFLLTVIISIALVFGAGSAYSFDSVVSGFGDLMNSDYQIKLPESIVYVEARGTAIGFAPEFKESQYGLIFPTGKPLMIEGETHAKGTGVYIGDGLVLTVAHVAVPREVTVRTSEYTYWTVPVWERSSNLVMVAGYPATVRWYNDELDMAILDVGLTAGRLFFKAIPYELRSARYIWSGIPVGMITNDRYEDGDICDYQQRVEYGDIASSHIIAGEHDEPWFSMADFTLNMHVIPGDSGSPLFAFEDGKPVLIGLVRAKSVYGYSYAVRIDPILPYLRHIRNEKLEAYLMD